MEELDYEELNRQCIEFINDFDVHSIGKFEGLIIGLINRQGLLERRIKILENALKRSK